MRGKSLCIVDTSSLINSSEVLLGGRTLDKWLWDEFEIKYSKTVLEEFQKGRIRGNSRRKWEEHVWPLPPIVKYFFDTFPLGNIWSLLDFITYLFMRYYNRITLEDVENALRTANAQGGILLSPSEGLSEKKAQRLSAYLKKVYRIAEAFSQFS